MSVAHLDSLIDIADCLGTTVNTNGSIVMQTGDVLATEVNCDNVWWWQHIGFASRPANATPKASPPGAAQTINLTRSGGDITLASRDLRAQPGGQPIYGSIGPGETCIYAAGPNNTGTSRMIMKDDGSNPSSITTILQAGNSSSGLPITIQLSSDEKINIACSDKGAIAIDSTGINILSNKVLNLGGTDGVSIIGKTLGLNAGVVSLGANASQGVVIESGFSSWAGSVFQAITQIAALLNAAGPVIGAPGAVTPISLPPPNAISQSVKAAP